jgi:signal transduction histidine kinase
MNRTEIKKEKAGENPGTGVPLSQGSGTSSRSYEELYRRAISGVGAVPYGYDFKTNSYTFMGAGIEDLIGYKPGEITAGLWFRIIRESVMLGEAAGLSKDEAARRVKAGEILQWRCDMHVLTKLGNLRWISDASVQCLDDRGSPIGSIGILQDITEHKQAETSARAFSKLGQDLFSTTTLQDASRIIAKVAGELLRWDGFFLHLYDSDLDEALPILAIDLINGERVEFTVSPREMPTPVLRRVLEKGAELILKETLVMESGSDPYGDKNHPSASILRVPLRVKAKPIGVLALHSYTFQAYSASDLNILQTLADYCSGAFERIWAEEKLLSLHKQLLESSRQAGMAEVATSVLHNVGNVLNSVNISASLISEKVRKSKAGNLAKAVALMQSHQTELAAFLADDPIGRKLPAYLAALADHLGQEQTQILREVASLTDNIAHIKEIVAMQQNYAQVAGVTESLQVADMVEDAIRLNEGSINRHNVKVVRDYNTPILVVVDKHRVLQILVNLIRNAKYALDEGNPPEKLLTIRILAAGDDRVQISINDNGIGIPPGNMVRIFEHGFTTRKEGHGFGLHSAALTAKELGGTLSVQSDGTGKGATFILDIPRRPPKSKY